MCICLHVCIVCVIATMISYAASAKAAAFGEALKIDPNARAKADEVCDWLYVLMFHSWPY